MLPKNRVRWSRGASRHATSGHFVVPGSPFPLALMRAIFSAKYVVNALLASPAVAPPYRVIGRDASFFCCDCNT